MAKNESLVSRAARKIEAGEVATRTGGRGYAAMNRGVGGLKQRTLDAAVKAVGGRGSKAVEAARSTASASRAYNRTERALGPVGEVSANYNRMERGASVLQRLGRNGTTLLRGAAKGMLSPAGLAEGVAGNVAKLSDKAGRQALSSQMHKNDKVKMPPPPKAGKRKA